MGLIVNIKENDQYKTVRFSLYPLSSCFLFIGFIIATLNWLKIITWPWYLGIPFLFIGFIIAIPSWIVSSEIKKAEKEDRIVEIKGNKFSFDDPLTITILKYNQ